MFKQVFGAALICVSAMACHATTGSELLQYCREAEKRIENRDPNFDPLSFGYCVGLIEGIKNTLTVTSHFAKTNCLPATITNEQAIRIVLKHLRANPESLHHDGSVLVIEAFGNTFTCRQ